MKASGEVIGVFLAADSSGDLVSHEQAQLDEGRGIVGDRYYDQHPDAAITLVDADAIEAVNAETGWALKPEETRRNVITRGVDLNQWERGRFRLGEIILEGVELCEPCASLGGMLENAARTPAEVVKALTHRAGLRARIIEGGTVRVGDRVGDE